MSTHALAKREKIKQYLPCQHHHVARVPIQTKIYNCFFLHLLSFLYENFLNITMIVLHSLSIITFLFEVNVLKNYEILKLFLLTPSAGLAI